MGSFHTTVRDFSKLREGRQCLEKLFNYGVFPNPSLSPVPSDIGVANDLLGRAFENILQLVIERQNPNFEFEAPFKVEFGGPRTKKANEIKHYFESGELTDGLLDLIILLAQEKQKSFKIIRSRAKRPVNDGLKNELQRLHRLALNTNWNVNGSFFAGMLTDSRKVAAEADLIIDAALIEVKTVKDTRKHDEHLSQLFSYFLLSQVPMRKDACSQ